MRTDDREKKKKTARLLLILENPDGKHVFFLLGLTDEGHSMLHRPIDTKLSLGVGLICSRPN